jgi:hypothetical protein
VEESPSGEESDTAGSNGASGSKQRCCSRAFAAAFLDMWLKAYEVGALASSVMHHMFVANALEGGARPGPLRQRPDECVRYVGRAPRRHHTERLPWLVQARWLPDSRSISMKAALSA